LCALAVPAVTGAAPDCCEHCGAGEEPAALVELPRLRPPAPILTRAHAAQPGHAA